MIRACRAARWLSGLLWLLVAVGAGAQELVFQPPASPLDAGAASILRDLAVRVLPVYEERDPGRFLDNLSALQVVAGAYAPAAATRASLRRRRAAQADGQARVLDLYIEALAQAQGGRDGFAQAFPRVFRAAVMPLDDLEAFAITGWRVGDLAERQRALQRTLAQYRERGSIPLAEAVDLLRSYFIFDALRTVQQPLLELGGEDDHRRYVFETLSVAAADGTPIVTRVVRPRAGEPAPALLEFTVPPDPGAPVTGPAAHGYAGVVAEVRGSGQGMRPVPFQFDGVDAAAVIQWIAQRPWSDGRVAMYGQGYSGFAAWAAAGHAPPALVAIATLDPLAPGIDVPMAGGIFHNAAYRWVRRLATGGVAGPVADAGAPAWLAADLTWYAGGQRYRDFDRISGARDRFFQRWINHPSYDRFWQKMIPFGPQFSGLRIPVLTVVAADSPSQPAALHYFREHLHYQPDADHDLLLVPPAPWPRADLDALRYQWFDHVLRAAPRPALLEDRVNYFVTGAGSDPGTDAGVGGQWRHAGSLDAMGNTRLRLYLDASEVPGGHLLARRRGLASAFVSSEVDLRQREDAGTPGRRQAGEAVTWISGPLAAPLEITGEPAGLLDLVVNRQDVDLSFALYELRPDGRYLPLVQPQVSFRASYARGRTQRRLLKAGQLQQVPLQAGRLISQRVDAGSRLVLVLGVNRRPDQQVNYGAGNDVSEESVAEARVPLRLRWYGSSYLALPVRR